MNNSENKKTAQGVAVRAGACVALILVGLGGLSLFARMKKPPAEVEFKERAIRVETLIAEPENVPVTISGFGRAQSVNVVQISPEVPGVIVQIHPNLEVGETIGTGEVLFRVDPRDYKNTLAETSAAVQQLSSSVERLKQLQATDQARLKRVSRSRDLARNHFTRTRRLLDEDGVGSIGETEAAERAFNSAADMYDQLAGAVQRYPLQITEAEEGLTSAGARLKRTKTNLDRCVVKAPFDCRISSVTLEQGQYVAPGQPVCALADDSELEIRVPLSSSDVRRWLKFKDNTMDANTAWFGPLTPVPCELSWTEDREGHRWTGILNRVVQFTPQTRTVLVAIRISGNQASKGGSGSIPLVDGMFCSVSIPGHELKQVVRLPRWSVTFNNNAYLAKDGRLVTVPVQVARMEGDEAFVSAGIQPGDTVITTRLTSPLEGNLLDIAPTPQPGSSSDSMGDNNP